MREWSPSFCLAFFYVLGLGGLALLFAVEVALQVRVYVLFDCSVRLAVINGVLFGIEAVGTVTFLMLDTVKYTRELSPCYFGADADGQRPATKTPPGLTGCWSASASIMQNWTKYMWYFSASSFMIRGAVY